MSVKKLLTVALLAAISTVATPPAAEAGFLKKIIAVIENGLHDLGDELEDLIGIDLDLEDNLEEAIHDVGDELEDLTGVDLDWKDDLASAGKGTAKAAEKLIKEGERFVDDIKDAVKEAGSDLDDEILQPAKRTVRTFIVRPVEKTGKEIGRFGNRVGKEAERVICRIPEALGAECNVSAGVVVDSDGNVTGTDGRGKPSEKPIPQDENPSILPDGGVAGRTPASQLPGAVVNVIWRVVKGELDDKLHKALSPFEIAPLNVGEDKMLDRWFFEQVAADVTRRTGLTLPKGALPSGSRFREYQPVVEEMVEKVLLDEEYRKWQATLPVGGSTLPVAPLPSSPCDSEPCLRAVAPK